MQTDAAAATERPAALAAIGSTPIVRLTRLAGPDAAEVWVKLEAANPTGSYKDRMALSMIEGAERSGRSTSSPRATTPTSWRPRSCSIATSSSRSAT